MQPRYHEHAYGIYYRGTAGIIVKREKRMLRVNESVDIMGMVRRI